MIILPSDHPVARLWVLFDALDFATAAGLFHGDFIMEFPQTRERFCGRDNFIAFNAHYPGHWRCRVRHAVHSGDNVVTETDVSDGEIAITAVSFFTLKDNLIWYAREYWPEVYPAPEWRRQWVELY